MTVKIDGSTGVDKVQPLSIEQEDLKWVPPFTKEYVSPEQVITSGGLTSIAHGLAAAPKQVQSFIVCNVVEQGYSIGDVLKVEFTTTNGSGNQVYNFMVSCDEANLYATCAANGIAGINKSTGAYVSLTPANWRLIVRAWA